MVDKAEITGGVGMPPPHAPHEVSQPLSDVLVQEQLARAAANERELAPLTFAPTTPSSGPTPVRAASHEGVPVPPVREAHPVTQAMVGAVDALTSGARRIRQVLRRPETPAEVESAGIVLTDAEPSVTADPDPAPPSGPPAQIVGPAVHQPAGSNTDSPSRGVPRPVDDPGKKITGGFGDGGEAQYFPLTGIELREVVYSLLDQIHARCQDDLRFSLAICYPRVAVRVDVVVEGYPVDTGFVIPTVARPHTQTPLEVAREYADEAVFVLTAAHVEMTPEEASVTPPNKIRQVLGLPVPRKQAIETPTGRQYVDVR